MDPFLITLIVGIPLSILALKLGLGFLIRIENWNRDRRMSAREGEDDSTPR